jgi:hypothetical protein
MVNFLVSAMVITYAMGPIALLCLRKTLPNKERPFKLPAANFLCLLAFYSCNLFSYWTGWETISKLSIALIVGFALFAVASMRGVVKMNANDMKAAYWIVPYITGLIIISYLGAFGGTGFIPFGWDFLVVGLFTLGILYLALATRVELNHQEVSDFLAAEDSMVIEAH